jgi:hypothetical protein|tara:strand:+ start:3077 stop:3394 length:318 start_codon:yes stop_codon:yes gene_type:complete
MNFYLKSYINKLKGHCCRLGFRIRFAETGRNTTAIVYNSEVEKIILLNLETDIYGGIPEIRAYLVNPPRYRWASAEGFTLDQMMELKRERVFIEVDASRTANYLL